MGGTQSAGCADWGKLSCFRPSRGLCTRWNGSTSFDSFDDGGTGVAAVPLRAPRLGGDVDIVAPVGEVTGSDAPQTLQLALASGLPAKWHDEQVCGMVKVGLQKSFNQTTLWHNNNCSSY